ncbi:hypothetical protein ebA2631 [Aromatoleum aromaticum EbN1]|uniref:Uncharacterized protein n=1 Tax=Aromatoleum aromaticum (strain DSM 19018 / LMG 30748 / EbN1) TaxID=76114 RepID=Q5P508_AROAE|nr:hypothetical protein ebA2631 [Aromatoleum aromaticum EbN1]
MHAGSFGRRCTRARCNASCIRSSECSAGEAFPLTGADDGLCDRRKAKKGSGRRSRRALPSGGQSGFRPVRPEAARCGCPCCTGSRGKCVPR